MFLIRMRGLSTRMESRVVEEIVIYKKIWGRVCIKLRDFNERKTEELWGFLL